MPDALPRWSITIHPADSANPFDAQAINSITVNAENVTRGELAAVLANFLAAVVKHPNEVLPTVAQVDAYRAEQALLRDFPADVIYVCQGESVWLNSAMLTEPIDYTDSTNAGDSISLAVVLTDNGWTSAGATPTGAVKACEYARDSNTLLTKIHHTSVIEQ